MAKVSLDEFSDRLAGLLPRFIREFARYEDKHISQGIITLPQILALECLEISGPSQMGGLAKAMNLQMSSATGLVDRMIKQGFVDRKHSEEDRRVVTVQITTKGKKILKSIYRGRRNGLKEMYVSLNADERAKYLEILEKVLDALSQKVNLK